MMRTGPIIPENKSEAEIRALRDQVFGVPVSDKTWEACRQYWMRPDSVEWLKNKAKVRHELDTR